MRQARIITMVAAIAALAMICASGPGTRADWWGWSFGIALMRFAFYVGAAAAVASLGLVLLLAVPRWRAGPWLPIVSLCIALAAITPPLIALSRAKAVPPIHDISTDTVDPPGFVTLLEVRNKSPNGSAYGGTAIAEQQQKAYADIKPLDVASPPREALQKAIDAARAMQWEVVGSDAAAGRLEATDTTAWFAFKDDVVVRVRPNGTGSRIDVRSVSRVGTSDIGANAARVREYLAKLK
ncbi:MAG: DUF1499 domain-containing protein [Usitatibacter sp.]